MSIRPFANASLAQAQSINVMQGGQLMPAKSVKVFANGSVAPVFSSAASLSVSVSPSNASGSAFGRSRQTVTTNSVTLTPQGGTGPYTYAWSIDTAGITITASSMATTAFSAVLFNAEISGTASVIVTDAHGFTASTTVPVDLEQSNGQ